MQINGMPAILSPCELKFIIIWDVALARLKMQKKRTVCDYKPL